MNKIKISPKGFTLIELLVVVLIIGVLTAVALPAYMRSVEKTRATEAIKALSDIAKAEHDYFYAQNRYTDDFNKLSLTIFPDATGSTYSTQSFDYTLEDDMASAVRDIGADSYTLYRIYDDPMTYCMPRNNKYCKMLGLPAGALGNSIGNWQSCDEYPCTKACIRNMTIGYRCEGTYNEDGTFSEEVCDSNNFCIITEFNAEQKATFKSICLSYDENRKCVGGFRTQFDEDGKSVAYVPCSAWDENNHCTEFADGGQYYERRYDNQGNIIRRQCLSRDEKGVCTELSSGGYVYSYDNNGLPTGYRWCSSFDEEGNCNNLSNTGTVYAYYDKNKQIYSATCNSYREDGTCESLAINGTYNKYDEEGKLISTTSGCSSYNQDGTCSNAMVLMETVFNYDSRGRKISQEACSSGMMYGNTVNCSGGVYTYDSNDRVTSIRSCTSFAEDGTCNTYGSGGDTNNDVVYTYAGNQRIGRTCVVWGANNTCNEYAATANIVTYDPNGKEIRNSWCNSWNSSTSSCDNMGSGSIITYDENGQQIMSIPCFGTIDSNGNCLSTFPGMTLGQCYVTDIYGNNELLPCVLNYN